LRSPRSARTDRLLITLPFYLLFLAQLANHQIWRDEINAWAISFISPNLTELFHRVHYEAHPALWYLILFTASRMSHSLWMLKLVEASIGTAIYALIAWASPFRRIELLLILCSYYFFFEYTVMCRMYSLELLFAMAYAWFRTRRPDWVIRSTLWLGLIANVDITGAILAGALLLEYGISRLTQSNVPAKLRLRDIATSLAIFTASMAISLETLWPAKDIGWSATGKMFSQFWDVGHFVQSVLKWVAVPWVPPPINLLDQWLTSGWFYFFLSPAILFVLYIIFRDHWRPGIILVAIIIVGTVFSHITGVAAARHTGIVYIGFLVALWMLRSQPTRVSPLVYLLLLLPVTPGIIAEIDQWSRPYSDSQAATDWIVQQHLENLPLFGTPDSNVIGVPERLNRPIYQLECACEDRVLTFSNRRDNFDRSKDTPASLIHGFQTLHVPTGLFLDNRKLSVVDQRQLAAGGLNQQLIGQFDRGLLGDEFIYIYRITANPPH